MVEYIFSKVLQWVWLGLIVLAILYKLYLAITTWVLNRRIEKSLDRLLGRDEFLRRPWK